MRVLQITTNFPTTKHPSFGIFVKEQISSLEKYNVTNQVFFINGREKGKLEYIKAIFKLKKLIKNNEIEIIHCHHALSALTLLLSGFFKIKNYKIIVSYQNDPPNELGLKMFEFIKKRTSVRIYKNKEFLKFDAKGIYLPNGVDLSLFHPIPKEIACKKLNLDKNKIYILFVSSSYMRKQKRIDRFKKVIEILKSTYGHDNIEELILMNAKRELMPYYFNAVDVHLMTSDFEGSPNSIKECLACNTKVVSTDVGNVKELISGINGCFVSESKEEEELAWLVDKALKLKCENGRDRIIKKGLGLNMIADKLYLIYQQVLVK